VHRERSSAYRQNASDHPHVWFIPARSTHQKYQIPLMNFWSRMRACVRAYERRRERKYMDKANDDPAEIFHLGMSLAVKNDGLCRVQGRNPFCPCVSRNRRTYLCACNYSSCTLDWFYAVLCEAHKTRTRREDENLQPANAREGKNSRRL